MTSKVILLLTLNVLSLGLFSQISFTEDSQNTFENVAEGDQRFADLDGDGDLDLIYVGYALQFNAKSLIYLNDGDGNFTELLTDDLVGVGYSAVDVTDVDGDNDIDILIAGQGAVGISTDLYLNDGSANFTKAPNPGFAAMANGIVKFADIDGDDDPDVFISGLNASFTAAVTELYKNDGNGNFNLVTDSPIIKVYQGASDFSDIDNDGDLDLIVTGVLGSNFEPSTNLYINDGNGKYELNTDHPFIDVQVSTANFADIDNDGDEDLLLTGRGTSVFNTKLYENDGNGNFNLNASSQLVEVIFGAVTFGDIDLDDDLDLIIAGRKGAIPDETTELYINDGSGVFTKLLNTPFTGATAGGVQIADVNGDNFPDIFVTGFAPDQQEYSKLYINDLVLSSKDTEGKDLAEIYPNPVSELFTFKKDTDSKTLKINIVDLLGRKVMDGKFNNQNSVLISSKNLVAGSYILSWSDEENNKGSIPFVKQ